MIRETPLPPNARPLFAALVVSCLCLALQGLGESAVEALQYQRSALQSGQLWRLVSAHLVHLGWGHVLLNVSALCLVAWIFARACTVGCLAILGLAAAAAIDLGLWLLDPQIHWYVGLSGVLHGLLAGCVVLELAHGWRASAWIALALAAKLAWEQAFGPLPLTAEAAGGPVVVQAHLYGALGGSLAALAMIAVQRRAATV